MGRDQLYYTGAPASGAGSRSTSCGTGSASADADGSATVGSGDADAGGSGDDGVSGSAERVGDGSSPGGCGIPGRSLRPGLGPFEAATLRPADGEAAGDPEPSGPPFFPPLPSPRPPPPTPDPPPPA
ncbi:hypothetical protein ABZY42_31040 [Streptomyces sp. NPDC006622]|uniref:hypothetical protein n=1 Tax=Streptomyces sp. NPDC006622 TaxID=3155459 RepID=UPI0033A15815